MTHSPKPRYLPFAAVLGLGVLICNSANARSGRPPLNTTGAPPQNQTCNVCHTGEGSGALEIEFADGDLGYTPNGLYDLRIILAEQGQTRFGYEATSRIGDEPETAIGGWIPGEDSQVFDEGRHIGHTDAPYSDDQHVFEVQWAAPSENIGDVTFYVSGITANGDGSTEGDNAYALSFIIPAAAEPTFWAASPVHEDGWRYSGEGYSELAGIGWIWDGSWPWVYTYSQEAPETGEWIWIAQGNTDSFWGYNATDDFWFWADATSGWYYSYASGAEGWQPYAL